MKLQFDWLDDIGNTTKDSIEKFLKNDLERPPYPLLNACHQGTVTISLSCRQDPLHESFVGTAICSCGNTFGTIEGIANGPIEYYPCNISIAI